MRHSEPKNPDSGSIFSEMWDPNPIKIQWNRTGTVPVHIRNPVSNIPAASVPELGHFGRDPDPGIRTSD